MNSTRNKLLIICLILACAALFVHFIGLKFDYLKDRRQGHRTTLIPSRRGDILDRNGKLIATSIKLQDLYFYTAGLSRKEAAFVMSKIEKVLAAYGADKQELVLLRRDFKKAFARKGAFCVIKDLIDNSIYRQIIDSAGSAGGSSIKDIRGKVYLTDKYKRYYPFSSVYGTLTGYISKQGNAAYGIEESLDGKLAGIDGEMITSASPYIKKGRWGRTNWLKEPQNGNDVRLSLDSVIQEYTYRVLRDAVTTHRAKGACAIVMETATGKVRAFASLPSFDPNNYFDHEISDYMNIGVSNLYEPGSIMKPLVIGFILEQSRGGSAPVLRKGDKFYCENGKYRMENGRLIEDVEKLKTLSVLEIIAHSSNIGVTKIMQKYEAAGDKLEFYRFMISILNLQRSLNVPLTNHTKGSILDYGKWIKNYSMISICMGYEVSSSPLNFVTAFNVIPAGGKLLRPLFLENEKPEIYTKDLFSSGTLDFLNEALKEVVRTGTAKKIGGSGLELAGKTGTARKYDPELKTYSKEKYIASFIGYFPATAPVYTIGVFIDEPKSRIYGSEVAAPVFRSIAERVNAYYLNRKTYYTKSEEADER